MAFLVRYSHGFSKTLFEYSFGVEFDIRKAAGELLYHRTNDTLHITAFGAEYDFLVNQGLITANGEKGICKTFEHDKIVKMLVAFKQNGHTYMVA